MYAETFGIQNPSGPVETAARWVQFAQAGIMAGASEHESEIRYNLDQFWQAKTTVYPSSSAADRAALERLDTYAHGLWNALETGLIFSASPGYWAFWKSWIGGGTPARPESYAAASAAATAAIGQQESARRLESVDPSQTSYAQGMETLARNNLTNLPQVVASANSFWNQAGLVNPLGIPWWAWLLGAAGLYVVVKR